MREYKKVVLYTRQPMRILLDRETTREQKIQAYMEVCPKVTLEEATTEIEKIIGHPYKEEPKVTMLDKDWHPVEYGEKTKIKRN